VLDQVAPERGYEPALAAALGDDLHAGLDPANAAHWTGAEAEAPVWPAGVTPLDRHVRAPAQLAARLAYVGVVERDAAERLAGALPPGARLVTREGDLWRWDGFVARAEAPKPAAVRLAQKTRLAELAAEIEALEPAAKAAAADQAAGVERIRLAEARLRAARTAVGDAERAAAAARDLVERHAREAARREARMAALDDTLARLTAEHAEAEAALEAAPEAGVGPDTGALAAARLEAATAREAAAQARSALDAERREREGREKRLSALRADAADWTRRSAAAAARVQELAGRRTTLEAQLAAAREAPPRLAAERDRLLDELGTAEVRRARAGDALAAAESERAAAERAARLADAQSSAAREARAAADARLEAASARLEEAAAQLRETAKMEPDALGRALAEGAVAIPADAVAVEAHLHALERRRDAIGPVNLRAEEEAEEQAARLAQMQAERADLSAAIARLREGIESLNAEGRERLLAAFAIINAAFSDLFKTLFDGGEAALTLVEAPDPLEAGLEILACPPGKRLASMSLLSGGEQALTAAALIFAVFLSNPAPVCVLDEVDAPLDDANVDRFCRLLDEMRRRSGTRFIVITHNAVTMSRMDRLFGVTMGERGVSQLVSVDLRQAELMAAE